MGSGALASGMTDDAVPINCPKRHELASSNVDRKRDRYSKRKYRGQFWNRKELSFFFCPRQMRQGSEVHMAHLPNYGKHNECTIESSQ